MPGTSNALQLNLDNLKNFKKRICCRTAREEHRGFGSNFIRFIFTLTIRTGMDTSRTTSRWLTVSFQRLVSLPIYPDDAR